MTERESQTQLRVGIFVLAAIVLFVAFVLTIGSQTRVFEGRYTLRASFSTIEGLIVGAPVRLAGFTVGHVARIGFGQRPGDKHLVVELSVDRRYQDKIREDSVSTISTIGLVGDKYVEITVGSEDRKPLAPMASIPSLDPLDYGKLLQKGDQIMTSVSKLSNALEEFFAGSATAETRRNLAATIASVRRTFAEVEEGRLVMQVARAAAALGTAGEGLARAAATTDTTLADLRGVLREVKEGQGLLHALVYDREGGEALARLARAVQAIEDLARAAKEGPGLLHALIADPKGGRLVSDLADAAADLKRVTGKLAGGEGTLGALLDDPTLYEDLSTLFRGAERSWILRSVIRSGLKRGEEPKP